ncbi:MAG: hypothetical protein GXO22_05500 [Aquificae bacterium]|nr:hypothetical protein [Aquificota bacterium]
MDFDTVCEHLTSSPDSVLKMEQYILDSLKENPKGEIYLFSFSPLRTFDFSSLDEEQKKELVKNIIQEIKASFKDKAKILGRHVLVVDMSREDLEEKLVKLVKKLKEDFDIPLHIGVIRITDKLSPSQIILDLERCLFMSMCVPDQMLIDCLVRFCEDR